MKGSTITLMAEWLGPNGQVVSQETAQARADVCLKCPVRGPLPPLLGIAADSIRRLLIFKNGMNLRVVGEKSLGICRACECVNRLKVWMPREKVLKELDENEISKLDGRCWIINEKT